MGLPLIGKKIRILRIEHDVSLKYMADQLGVTASWLSQIETGRRTPPESLIRQIIGVYMLNDDEANGMLAAAALARECVLIKPASFEAASLALKFAERLNLLNPAQLTEVENALA